MLEVVLHILSILGILILVLLGLLAALLLAVLFFPVSYRICGSKDAENCTLTAKAWWLFGLLRVSYSYPDPGYAVAKALFFRLFDTAPSEKDKAEKKSRGNAKKCRKKNAGENPGRQKAPEASGQEDEGEAKEAEKAVKASEQVSEEKEEGSSEGEAVSQEEANRTEKGFFQKIRKIKYTIWGLCDKIREIWKNILYYMELLQEEDTKQLFSHGLLRTGKILKDIRPRHIKAQLIFGFDSPDITGCVYGLYCMLASTLGPRVRVEPDFENRVLRGELEVQGRITVWVALTNGLRFVLDKRLKTFLSKMKKEEREMGSQNGGKNGGQGKS